MCLVAIFFLDADHFAMHSYPVRLSPTQLQCGIFFVGFHLHFSFRGFIVWSNRCK